MYNVDSYFEIGSGHQICQDFATHGQLTVPEFGTVVWGIVSDGCSGSPNSDTGARVLTHMMDKAIKNFLAVCPSVFDQPVELLKNTLFAGVMGTGPRKCAPILGAITCLGLDVESLDATLWVLLSITKNGKTTFKIVGWGDGELVVVRKKSTTIHFLEYPSGAPFYLSYHLDAERLLKYLNVFGGILRHDVLCSDGEILSVCGRDLSCQQTFMTTVEDISDNDIVSVSVFTDGTKTYNKDVQDRDVWSIKRLVDFQSVEGAFLQRRMKAVERRDSKERILHHDDIGAVSMALLEE